MYVMRLVKQLPLVEGPPGDAPWFEDYTQRLTAWSILLDGSRCVLVEEFRGHFNLNGNVPLHPWESEFHPLN